MSENLNCFLLPDIVDVVPDSISNASVNANNSFTLNISMGNIDENSIFFITFPWGNQINDLTNNEGAMNIICTPLNEGCTVNRLENSQLGYFFVVCCNNVQDEVLQVRFQKINALDEGITCLRIRNVTDCEDIELEKEKKSPFYEIPIIKQQLKLNIQKFAVDTGTVTKGKKTTLSWCVQGADTCILEPGNYYVKAEGSRQLFLEKNTTFTLRAWSKRKAVSKTVTAFVE